jgi:hypothetical protein
MTGPVSTARAVSSVIGIVATEAALSPAERLIEGVYRNDLTEQERHDVASVLRAVQIAADFREKGAVSRRLILLDDIETRWADAVGESDTCDCPERTEK